MTFLQVEFYKYPTVNPDLGDRKISCASIEIQQRFQGFSWNIPLRQAFFVM